MTAQVEQFRLSFRILLLWSLIYSSLLVLSIFLMAAFLGIRMPLQRILLLSIVAVLSTAMGSWLQARAQKVHVSTFGMLCFGRFGLVKSVAWKDVEKAEYRRTLGLPQLRISARSHPVPVRLPLYLVEGAAFATSVSRFAGAESPIYRALPRTWRSTNS